MTATKTGWKEETPRIPRRSSRIDGRDLFLSVSEEPDGKIWQYFHMTIGKFNENDSFGDCQREWERAAIAEARERLDEFEQQLNRGDDDE